MNHQKKSNSSHYVATILALLAMGLLGNSSSNKDDKVPKLPSIAINVNMLNNIKVAIDNSAEMGKMAPGNASALKTGTRQRQTASKVRKSAKHKKSSYKHY